jgi:hypothetical protein
MSGRLGVLSGLFVALFTAFAAAPAADAATTCTFTVAGSTMTLDGDCTTDQTITVPDGFTLDGAGYTITAVDPPAGSFKGAVVRNAGASAHVTRLVVTAFDLANVCDAGAPVDTRLRGILFEGAGGSITRTTVVGINQGASGCQEGNAIEVRKAPFDGTHPAPVTVEIAHNLVEGYQKTGIVTNGDVIASIHHNDIGASATEANLAANGLQVGFGATASVEHNAIAGHQWCGGSDFAATAVLLFDAGAGTAVRQNNVRRNADVGIYAFADGVTIENNRVFEDGSDCNPFGYDTGIGDYGVGNTVTNNKVRGYADPYDPASLTSKGGGKNKAIPSPHE